MVDVVAALEVAEEVVDSVAGAREASNRRVAVTVDTATVRGKSRCRVSKLYTDMRSGGGGYGGGSSYGGGAGGGGSGGGYR